MAGNCHFIGEDHLLSSDFLRPHGPPVRPAPNRRFTSLMVSV